MSGPLGSGTEGHSLPNMVAGPQRQGGAGELGWLLPGTRHASLSRSLSAKRGLLASSWSNLENEGFSDIPVMKVLQGV